MSVDDWARREAKEFNDAADEDFSRGVESAFGADEDSFSTGAAHAFDALLSDEALRAMQSQLISAEQPFVSMNDLYCAVEAAIDAVTKEARNER